MTTYSLDDIRSEFLAGRSAAPAGEGLATRLWIAAYRAVQRARSRRQMLGLTDEMLKDVGLTRADIEREAAKPFWR